MASNDSLVASFWTKYHYKLWRPETAIREGNVDGNPKTDADLAYLPYILTPCFPSYPSNHGSGSNSAAEILRRVYGAGGHHITMTNPAVPGVTFHYTRFSQITDDISDARIYGGIHFRFDQEAGADLGHDIGDLCLQAQPPPREAWRPRRRRRPRRRSRRPLASSRLTRFQKRWSGPSRSRSRVRRAEMITGAGRPA